MRKITYIIDNLLTGGAQVHLLRLTDALNDKSYGIKIISLGDTDRDIARNAKSPILNLRMDCIWQISFWSNFLRLISLLKKDTPDIVHTYLNTSNVFGVFAARLAGVPIVISSRRDLGHFRSKKIGILEKISARLSDKIVCVSQAVMDKAVNEQGIPREKTLVIYNGVDAGIFKPGVKSADNLNIAMVAAMDRKEKGHFYFIEAARLVINERKDVKFTLIGDGPLEASLKEYAFEKGISRYFDFRGRRNDLAKELGDVDIIVVPSQSEGCSNALLEAMAMAITPIATALEGNLEVIEQGVSGFLVEPRKEGAIANKILELANCRQKIREIGVNAHKRISEKFTLEAMAENYFRLYENLIRAKGLTFKAGYVVSLFPCWSETFILNEIAALSKKGIAITIFSIRRDLEKFTQEKAKPYLESTRYITIPGVISSLLIWALKKPFALMSLFTLAFSEKPKRQDKLSKNLWSIAAGCLFARIAKKEGLSHIHAHFASYPATCAMAISRLSGIPFTFTAHAHDIFIDKSLLKEKIDASKAVVAVSGYNQKYIADYCGNGTASKIRVIHCGVDLSEYPQTQARNLNPKAVIVGIGRLVRMKGFEHLIRACAKIKDKLPFECRIIGDGPLRNELNKLINDSGLGNSVFLDGILDNNRVKDLLKEASALVLPSVWDDKDGQDGIPLVLMEAMAQGVPVISSNISGIPELIEDFKSGLLVEPKDTAGLAKKLLLVLSDKDLQSRLALQARKKVAQEFNIAKSADLLFKLFTDD